MFVDAGVETSDLRMGTRFFFNNCEVIAIRQSFMVLHTYEQKYLCEPMSQGYRSMTLLATQEQFGKQRFSFDRPTIQSGLGII
jgi:hypothetical protein